MCLSIFVLLSARLSIDKNVTNVIDREKNCNEETLQEEKSKKECSTPQGIERKEEIMMSYISFD